MELRRLFYKIQEFKRSIHAVCEAGSRKEQGKDQVSFSLFFLFIESHNSCQKVAFTKKIIFLERMYLHLPDILILSVSV